MISQPPSCVLRFSMTHYGTTMVNRAKGYVNWIGCVAKNTVAGQSIGRVQKEYVGLCYLQGSQTRARAVRIKPHRVMRGPAENNWCVLTSRALCVVSQGLTWHNQLYVRWSFCIHSRVYKICAWKKAQWNHSEEVQHTHVDSQPQGRKTLL